MKTGLLIALLFWPCLLLAQDGKDVPNPKTFQQWLGEIRQKALAEGISEDTLKVLDGLEPDSRVIGFDRNQPEFVQTFDEYLRARVTDEKVRHARQEYRKNKKVLDAIGETYGVEPQYIVAFWGLESGFGKYQGKYSVVRSLATLAYDPRRSAFFTKQLMSALKILDQGHIDASDFVGGWAGAMGQNQFMPTTFLAYAQDYDGDGKKNIWSDEQDVWASIAYFLQRNGWKKGEGWGAQALLSHKVDFDDLKPAKVPAGCTAYREQTRPMSISKWQSLGVTGNFGHLPADKYAVVIPDEDTRIVYLVGGNFPVILDYNCANKYAVSIGMMADLIKARP